MSYPVLKLAHALKPQTWTLLAVGCILSLASANALCPNPAPRADARLK